MEQYVSRRQRPPSARSRWRSTTAAAGLLVRRRARRDLALLLSWVILVAVAGALSVVVPSLIADTNDRGARQAVAAAGESADLVVRAAIGDTRESLEVMTPEQAVALETEIPGRLPPLLASVTTGGAVATVLTPDFSVAETDPTGPTVAIGAQLATVTADRLAALEIVEGRLAEDVPEGEPIEVVLSADVAGAASVGRGSVLTTTSGSETASFVVVGLVKVPGEFADLPTLSTARVVAGVTGVTLLTTPAGVASAEPLFTEPILASVRITFDPETFTAALVDDVNDAIKELQAKPATLAGSSPATLQVQSGLDAALDAYPVQASAALAQSSVMTVGLFGVIAAVILVLSRLITVRRSAEIALERARGASLAAVGLRALIESLLTVALGLALGVGAAVVATGSAREPLLITVIAVIAIAAPPVLSVAGARAVSIVRRKAANRQARQEQAGRGRAVRLSAEAGIVVLAGAALYAVRVRGLVRDDGVDPLLLVAPLLLAVAITLVIIRVYPLLVNTAAAIGERSRGTVGVLGAMQARQALAVVPLFALTLAVGVAVSGGLLVDTVRTGQDDASWQRIGADARVEGVLTDEVVSDVAQRPGVTAASAQYSRGSVELTGGPVYLTATVLAVDAAYPDIVDRLSGGVSGEQTNSGEGLRELAVASAGLGIDDALPVIVDAELARRLQGTDGALRFDQDRVSVRVIGVENRGPTGYAGNSFVYVDLDALSGRLDDIAPDRLLVMGGGAVDAVRDLADADHEVLSRADWLRDRQDLAFVGGVSTVMAIAATAVAVLAALTLIGTVLAGSRGRGRSLALLRTLGMRPRIGWWLAIADVAPLVIAALIGGIAAGIGIVTIIGPSLGLAILAGGPTTPVLSISPLIVSAVVGTAIVLLGLALFVEVIAHRRARLNDVLRVGETV